MKSMINKSALLEIKDFNDESRTVKGYASVFSNVDSDNDVLLKGAFNRTIKAWGPEGKNRIKLVSQHNIGQPLAKMEVLKEDDNGLYMEAKFGTHTAGEDHYRMVKEGILTEFSIGFVPIKEDKNDNGGRDFSEVKLYEVSLVTVAANDKALVTEVKSIKPEEDILESMLTLSKSIEDQDELSHKLESHILTLKSFEETATQPESDDSLVKEDSLDPVVKKDDFEQMLDILA